MERNPPHPNPLLSKERGQRQKYCIDFSELRNWENYGLSPSPYQGEGGRRPDEVNLGIKR